METAVDFAVGSERLKGVLHTPEKCPASGNAGIVFLHGWSGCRLGPHRMFVHAARRFAGLGFPCLRFDFRGRGESGGATRDTTIPTMIDDAIAAIDVLQKHAGTPRVILAGICSGAKVAIGTAAGERSVDGLILWSAEMIGPLRSGAADRQQTLSALRGYAAKLTQAATWRKLVTGRANWRLVRKAVLHEESPTDAETANEAPILDRFARYKGKVLFVYGTTDPDAALSLNRYKAFCRTAGMRSEFHEVAEANHNFSSLAWEEEALTITGQWLSA